MPDTASPNAPTPATTIAIDTRFAFHTPEPMDILLQFEVADIPEQRILSAETVMDDALHCARVAAEDAIGERVWLRVEGDFAVRHLARVVPQRRIVDLASLARMEPHDLPGETVPYLLDSRYCPADRFQSFVEDEFGGTAGGARALAITSWIADNLTYEPGSSTPATTGLDSFIERRGVCRDFAHVLVMLARASGLPARFVACYAPGVTPPDFHAVAEVFLADDAGDGANGADTGSSSSNAPQSDSPSSKAPKSHASSTPDAPQSDASQTSEPDIGTSPTPQSPNTHASNTHASPSGSWHLLDATGMASAADIVKIGVGRDAADVSFLTSFGNAQMTDQCVSVEVESP